MIQETELNSYNMFMSEIREYPLLSEQEEKELLLRIKDGDIEARNKFICHNLRLVVSIAMSTPLKKEKSDVIQDGIIGMMRALETYDSDLGAFSTYATHWIKQAIYRRNCDLMRKPDYLQREYSQYRKAIDTLDRNCMEKSYKNISRLTGFKEDKIKILEAVFNEPMSFEAPLPGTEEFSLEDIIESDLTEYDNIDYRMDMQRLREFFEEYMSQNLEPLQEAVLKLYIRWDSDPLPCPDIAERFSITEDRARNMIHASLRELRHYRNRYRIEKEFPDLTNHAISMTPQYDMKEYTEALMRIKIKGNLLPGNIIIIDGHRYSFKQLTSVLVATEDYKEIVLDSESIKDVYIDSSGVLNVITTASFRYDLYRMRA